MLCGLSRWRFDSPCVRQPTDHARCGCRDVPARPSVRRAVGVTQGSVRRPGPTARAAAGGHGINTVLAALATDLEHAVAVFLAEMVDAAAASNPAPGSPLRGR
jgi:hypothetical protein